jgi:hypothetical protein
MVDLMSLDPKSPLLPFQYRARSSGAMSHAKGIEMRAETTMTQGTSAIS